MPVLSPAFMIPVAVVFAVGIGFGIQAPLNAALGRAIGGGVAAAAVSFGVGFVALLILTFAFGQGGALAAATRQPPLLLAGGLLGAAVVWAMLWSVPTIGILSAFAALLLGQLGAALVLDAMGAFAAPVHPITPTRILALVMVAGGLILSRL
ncbi:DMT family transporter [Jannaschia sp. 2305UL9-9]|uniref:DMT family transporter n=1 Tax=Jannaschia sp. 2305UL9-9 TaxID=3121638 RepID=UPI003529A6F3